MDSKSQKYDTLIENAIINGESVDSYGEYDDDSKKGHDVELIEHGGLWLVAERDDGDEDVQDYLDEKEARKAFARIQGEIEKEENEDSAR
jgi:hypothetical protein